MSNRKLHIKNENLLLLQILIRILKGCIIKKID